MVSTVIAYFDSGQIVVAAIPFPLDNVGIVKLTELINSDEVAKVEIIPAQRFANIT